MKSANTASTFGSRLRQARLNKGLSQKTLGEAIGVHNTHVSRYEKDLTHPHASTLMKMADVLNVSADYLMEGTANQAAKERLADADLLRQFQMVDKLPNDKKQHIKFLIHSVVQNHNVESALAE